MPKQFHKVKQSSRSEGFSEEAIEACKPYLCMQAYSTCAGFKTNTVGMQKTTKCHSGEKTTASVYLERQGQADVNNKEARMFGITVSYIFSA